MLGLPLALVVGNLSAGWLNEMYGWRTTFVLLGFPGLVLGILAAMTLQEPRQARANIAPAEVEKQSSAAGPEPSTYAVFIALWVNKKFHYVLIAFCIQYLFVSGMAQWQGAFFVRTDNLGTGELGTWLAITYGVIGFFGTIVGGEMASRYAASNERMQLLGMAVAFAILAVVKAFVYIVPDVYWAIGALGAASFVAGTTNGPLFAVTQTLVPPHMRAVAVALVLLIANLIGAGLGPLFVGMVSDAMVLSRICMGRLAPVESERLRCDGSAAELLGRRGTHVQRRSLER